MKNPKDLGICVVYIDSTNSFSAQRIKEIIDNQLFKLNLHVIDKFLIF